MKITIHPYKNKFSLLLILLMVLFFQQLQATHIVGGVLEYTYMGPGALPNSSRFKIKMKIWRDAAGNPWFLSNPLIECRGDTLLPFDPVLSPSVGGVPDDIYTVPGRAGLGRVVTNAVRTSTGAAFNRDFRIYCGSYLDTLTVRSFSNTSSNGNTRIPPTSSIPYYENPTYTGTYPTAQYLTNSHGYIKGVCRANGSEISNLTGGVSEAADCERFSNDPYIPGVSDFQRTCVVQNSVDSCSTINFNIRIQYAEYIRVVDLPNIPGGYHLKHQICCRNQAVQNLTNEESYTVYARIPDFSVFDNSRVTVVTSVPGVANGLMAKNVNTSVVGFNSIARPDLTIVGTVSGMISQVVTLPGAVNTTLTGSNGTFTRNINFPGYTISGIVSGVVSIAGLGLQTITGTATRVVTPTGFVTNTTIRGSALVPNQITLPGVARTLTATGVISQSFIVPVSPIIFTFLGVNNTYSALSTNLIGLGLSSTLGVNQTIPGFAQITTTGRTNLPTQIRNSSPVFKSTPPLFICQYNNVYEAYEAAGGPPANIPYDHSATDADGDSITYELVSAQDAPPNEPDAYMGNWTGGTTNINGTVFNNGDPLYATMPFGNPSTYPNNVNISTFNYVTYRSLGGNTFSAIHPFGIPGIGSYAGITTPGISINSVTGVLTSKPRVPLGLYVVAVRAREFRRGTGEFLGEVTRDYQFRVEQCLLPAKADAIGNYVYEGDLYTRECNLNNVSIQNNSTPAATVAGIYYWDLGVNRYSSIADAITFSGVPMQQRYDVANPNTFRSTPIDIPSAYSRTISSPNFNFTNPGTYFVKLVVQNRSTNCADSAYHLVNVSPPLRSGWSQVPIGRVCVQLPVVFDPFVLTTTNGVISGPGINTVTTISNNSLWTDPNTNPIPMVWVESFTGINYTGTGVNDAVNLVNYTGWINHQWVTDISSVSGITHRKPPRPAERARVVNISWNFGDGVTQNLTLIGLNTVAGTTTGTNWIPLGGLQPRTTILGFNPATTALGNTLFLPRVVHSYLNSGTYTVTQAVFSQFGCTSSQSRTITIIQAQPTVAATGAGVCLNNPQTTLTGSVNGAVGAFWSGLSGTFSGVGMNNSSTFTGTGSIVGNYLFNTIYRPTTAELAVGNFLNVSITSWGNGVCPAGVATTTGQLVVEQIPQLVAGPSVTICGNNTDYTLNGSVSGSSSGGNFGARWRIITSTGINRGRFLSTTAITSTVLGDTYRFSTTHAGPNTGNDKSRGFVVLALESTNNGRCNTAMQTITITMAPDPLNPNVSLTGNNTVCGNNRTLTFSGSVLNSALGGIWSTTSTGMFLPTSVTGSLTVPSGISSIRFQPSSADSVNGSVILRLSSNITSTNGACFNVSTIVNIRITAPPQVFLPSIPNICPNNPLFSVTGTTLGFSNAVWSLSIGNAAIASVTSANFTPSANMPNLATLSGGRFTTRVGVQLTTTEIINGIPFIRPGTSYKIRLAVPATNGCLAVQRDTTIPVNIYPFVSVPPTASACKNNPLFNINPSVPAGNPPTLFQWSSSGSGSFNPNATTRSITYLPSPADTTAGSVRLIIRGDRPADNCLSVRDTIDITYITPPRVLAGADQQVCENNLRAQLSGDVRLNNIASTGVWTTLGAGTFQSTGTRTTTLLSDVYIPNSTDVSNTSVSLILAASGTIIGTALGQCNPVTDTMRITFTPIPQVLMPAVPVVCESNADADISATITGTNPDVNVNVGTRGIWSGGTGSYFPNNNSFTVGSLSGYGLSSVGTMRYSPSASEINALSVNLTLSVVGIGNCAAFTVPYSYGITSGPTINITNTNSPVCENNTGITLNGTFTGATGVLWSGGANSVTGTGNTITGFNASYVPSATEISNGSVKLYIITQNPINNCLPVRDSATIVINPAPRVTVGGDITSCLNSVNDPLVLNIIGSVSGITNVGIWSTNGSGTFAQTTIVGGNMATTYTPSVADKSLASGIQLTLRSANNGSCNAVSNRLNLFFSPTTRANVQTPNPVCLNFPFIDLDASGSSPGSWSANRPNGTYSSTNNNSSTSLLDTYRPVSTLTGGSTISFTWITNSTANCPSVSRTVVTTLLSAPSPRIVTVLTVTGNDVFIPLSATGSLFVPGYFSTDGTGTFTSSGTNTSLAQVQDAYRIHASDVARGLVNFSFTGISSSGYCRPVVTTVSVLILPEITVDAGLDVDFCADVSQITLSGRVFKNGVLDPQGTAIWEVVTAAGTITNPTTVVGAVYNIVPSDLNLPRRVFLRLRATDFSSFYPAALLPRDTVMYNLIPPPTATITSFPVEVCSDTAFIPLAATFSGAGTIVWSATGTGGFTYPSASITVARYTPSAADIALGRVSFSLLTQGSTVCSNRASSIVTTSITGKPTISAGLPETLCNNLTAITLTGAGMTVTGTPPPVVWGLSNITAPIGTISSNIILTNGVGSNPVYFPSTRERITDKLVTIFVTATGLGSCRAVTASKVITFFDAPTVNIGAATETYCGDTRQITLTGVTTLSPTGSWIANNGTGTFTSTANSGKTAVYSVSGIDVANLNTTLGFTFTTTFPGCNNEIGLKNIVLTTLPGVTITGSNGTLIKNPTICGDNLLISFAGMSRTGTGNWIYAQNGGMSPNSASVSNVLIGLTAAERTNAINTGVPIPIVLSSGATAVCAARFDTSRVTVTRPPQVFAGVNETYCENIPNITLTGATVTVASGVIWSSPTGGLFQNGLTTLVGTLSGVGQNRTVNNVVYTPSTAERNAGFVILTLRTSGSTVGGTCTEVSATKQITFVKAPIVNPISNISRCASDLTTSIAATTQNVVSQTWFENGTGGFSPTNTSNPLQYDFSTAEQLTLTNVVVTVTVSALGNNLCPMVSRNFELTITPKPRVTVGTLPVLCSDAVSVSITGSTKLLTSTGIQWSNVTNPSNTATNFNDRFSLNPVFFPGASDSALPLVKLLATTTNNGSCTPGTDTLYVSITPRPTISITGGNTNICSTDIGTGVQFRVNGTQLNLVKISTSGSGGFEDPNTGLIVSTLVSGINDNIVVYYPSAQDVQNKVVNIRFETFDKLNTLCGDYFATRNISFTGAPIVSANSITTCYQPNKQITFTGTIMGSETYSAFWHSTVNDTAIGVFFDSQQVTSSVRTVTGGSNGVFVLGTGVASLDLIYNVSGNSVCTGTYRDTVTLALPKQPNLSLTGPATICNDQNNLTLSYVDLFGWVGDPSLFYSNGEKLNWSARNSSGVSNFTDFASSPTAESPIYTLSNSDKNSNFIIFTATTSGLLSDCPNQSFTTTVTVNQAPRIQTVTGEIYCSNRTDGIPVSATITSSGVSIVSWKSNGASPGNFNSVSGPLVLNTFSGIYFPSASELASNSANLIFTASLAGCNLYTRSLNLSIKTAPVVDAGPDISFCPQSEFTVTGTIIPATTTTSAAWSSSPSAPLVPVFLGGTINALDGNNLVSTRVSSVSGFDINANRLINFTLTATEPGCNIVSDVVELNAQTILFPEPLPQTVCGTDLITMLTQPTSSQGVWSTSGLGSFTIPANSKTSSLINARYKPAFGEQGNVLFSFSSTSVPGGCISQATEFVNVFLKPGLFIKAAPKRTVAICTNKNPELSGTMTGTTISTWTTSGTGSFSVASVSTNNTIAGVLLGNFTTTGSPNVPIAHYRVSDIYIPSQADKDAGRVLLTMKAISDGSNDCGNSLDTLSIIFTNPPQANSKVGSKFLCGNTARAFGVTVNGSALLPTPNSTDSLATPINAAYWKVVNGTGVFTSTGSNNGSIFSVSGVGTDVILPVDDIYIPSIADLTTTVMLVLNTTYIGSAFVESACNQAIDTVLVTFGPTPTATITSSLTGICGDVSTISLRGRVLNAGGGVWSTTGTGSFTPNDEYSNSLPTIYNLSPAEQNSTTPIQLLFNLTTKDNFTCLAESAMPLTVTIQPKPELAVSSDQIVCSDIGTISLLGTDMRSASNAGSITGYTWSSNTNGAFPGGFVRSGSSLPAFYTINNFDLANQSINFRITATGNSLCKPIVTVTNVSIVPSPTISIFSNSPVCRDVDEIPVNVNITEASGVQWSVFRCVGGNCTIPGTGTLSFTGVSSVSGNYVPSADDRLSSVSGMLFSAITTGTYGSNPQCRQIITTTSVSFTDIPTVALVSGQSVCADVVAVNLSSTITGALGLVWSSTGTGAFSPSNTSNPSVSYELSQAESLNPFASIITVTGTIPAALCKSYFAATTISITGKPYIEAGDNISVCADVVSIPLSVTGATGNPTTTITGIASSLSGIVWTTTGSGRFQSSGTNVSTVLGDVYIPGTSDRTGNVILTLSLTDPTPLCNVIQDFRSIIFDQTPQIKVSAGLDQIVCAGNPLVNLNGTVINGNVNTNGWYAIKPNNSTSSGITTNSFCGSCLPGRGVFSDIRNLTGSYSPSDEDTLGATKATFTNFTNQVVQIVLTVNGLNQCSANVYSDTMQVTFTSRPVIQTPIIPFICSNDTRSVSLTGIFLNSIAGGGLWTTAGTGSFSPSRSQSNPPTVSGVEYLPSQADIARGQVKFFFTTQSMGDCPISSSSVDLIINEAPKFTPAVQNVRICETQTAVGLNVSGNNIQIANWRSTGGGVFTNNTNPGADLIFTSSGANISETYFPSLTDINNGTTALIVRSTSMSGCAFGDSARVNLTIDKINRVDAGLLDAYCIDEDTIPLKGNLNATNTPFVWTLASPASGKIVDNTSITTQYLSSTADRTASFGAYKFYMTSNNPTNKCSVAIDSVVINRTPLPVVSINNNISICTITAIQILADTQNVAYVYWTTSGTGGFSTSPFINNPVYRPGQVELTSGGVNLTFSAQGQGRCGVSTVQVNLPLVPNPVPTLNAGTDQIVCEFSSTLINVVNPNSNLYDYQWYRRGQTGTTLGLNTMAGLNDYSARVFASNSDSLYVLKATYRRFGCEAFDTVKVRPIFIPNLGLIPQVCYNDTLELPANRQVLRMPNSIAGGSFKWYFNSLTNAMNLPGSNDTTGVKALNPGLYLLEYTFPPVPPVGNSGCVKIASTQVRDIPRFDTEGRVTCVGDFKEIYPRVTNFNYGTDSLRYSWRNTHNITANPNMLSGVFFDSEPLITPIREVAIYQTAPSLVYLANVTITQGGLSCAASDSVRVRTHPVPVIDIRDVSVCTGETVLLNATPLTLVSPIVISYPPSLAQTTFVGNYLWSYNGSPLISTNGVAITNNTLTVSEAFRGNGLYVATFRIGNSTINGDDLGCVRTDSSNVSFNAKPVTNNLSTLNFCIDEVSGVTLDAGASGDPANPFRYLWLRSGNTSQYEQVFDTLTYYFKIFNRNNNCSVLDSINVKQKCDSKVFTPDAFIPDGSNPDDRVFKVFGKYFKEFKLRIYNRWGELIFESRDKNQGWDGTFNGSPMPVGAYPYTIEYKDQYGDSQNVRIKKGAVTLVR